MTLKVNIFFVRVPSVPIWRRHIRNHSNLECYYHVLRRPITDQLRNHSNHIFSSTAISSATSEYGAVPGRPSRNEEPISRNEEGTRNTPSSSLVSTSNEAQ